MGRSSHSRTLAVWMNGELVGHWRMAGGAQEFAYVESWLASPAARPLSLSLPLRPPGQPYRAEAAAYFDNLLPDNAEIRARMQRRFKADTTDAFDLLEEAGRDCIGAVQLVREGEQPPSIQRTAATKITRPEVARLLADALGRPNAFAESDAFRISLAGAQEKTALLWHNDAWHVPHGATPTTHILKLPIGRAAAGLDLSSSVENEWLCARLLAGHGIPVAPCRRESFGEFDVLVVERFDRRLSDNGKWWLRLPQEDFCQATATPSGLKYENDGGPGIRRIMDMLLGSDQAEADRRDFFRTLVVFWLLGAIDGHAKNFSIFLLPGGAFRLTPRYDVLSAHPFVGKGAGKLPLQKLRMAMALLGKNRHYDWMGIRLRHWRETARLCGLPDVDPLISELAERTPEVVAACERQLPADFPAPLADKIFAGTLASARALREELSK
jgi:serine/threonine-protein kinase HipA